MSRLARDPALWLMLAVADMGPASASELADDLQRRPEPVRRMLDLLMLDGLVHRKQRMGATRRRKYVRPIWRYSCTAEGLRRLNAELRARGMREVGS